MGLVGIGGMATPSLQMSQQILQRHKLSGRIDGRTSKSSVNVE
jgi:hypothetical protein